MLSDDAMRERMKNGWRAGKRDGTVCGQGSTLHNTRWIRDWLPRVCDAYDIRSVADAGAGDMHWMTAMYWGVEYHPYDLIPRSPDVQRLDVTTELMRDTDAILCRMVLNHLGDGDDYTRVEMALENFRETARYLLATHFEGGGPTRSKQFQRLDLIQWLGAPLESCPDGHEDNCRMALWEL